MWKFNVLFLPSMSLPDPLEPAVLRINGFLAEIPV